MKKYFSIGEISKMFEVSMDTLRYYDKIGILSPVYNKDNGYRLYSFKDIYLLSAILGARYLEIPIKDIKEYLNLEDLDLDLYLSFMEKQESILKEKIKHLEKIKKSVTESKKNMFKVKKFENQYDFHQLTLIKEEKKFYKIPIKKLIEKGLCKRFSKILEIYNVGIDYFTLFELKDERLETDEDFLYIEGNLQNEKILKRVNKNIKLNFDLINLRNNIVFMEFLGTEKEIVNYIIDVIKFKKIENPIVLLKRVSYFSKKSEDYAFVEIFLG